MALSPVDMFTCLGGYEEDGEDCGTDPCDQVSVVFSSSTTGTGSDGDVSHDVDDSSEGGESQVVSEDDIRMMEITPETRDLDDLQARMDRVEDPPPVSVSRIFRAIEQQEVELAPRSATVREHLSLTRPLSNPDGSSVRRMSQREVCSFICSKVPGKEHVECLLVRL
jgi:hypothetical protein